MVTKQARPKAKVEATRLEVEHNSLLLDIGVTKEEVSSL